MACGELGLISKHLSSIQGNLPHITTFFGGIGIWGLRFWVECIGFWILGFGFVVEGLGLRD